MAQAGVEIYTIAKILGHKTLSVTTRYAHHNVESLRHGLDAIVKVSVPKDTIGTVALQSVEKPASEAVLMERAG